MDVQDMMHEDMKRVMTVIDRLEAAGDYSIDDIVNNFVVREAQTDTLLFSFAAEQMQALLDAGRERTARAYMTAANRLLRFVGDDRFSMEQITSELIQEFETYLYDNGRTDNTVSFYMRNLRTLYNKAVAKQIIPPLNPNPFLKVYTGVHDASKTALSRKQIQALSHLAATLDDGKPGDTELAEALAYFMFSFHARGMSFIDMVFLRHDNLRRNCIRYKRRKNGQMLEVKITPAMKRIIDRYKTNAGDYLFPIIDPSRGDLALQYESALRLQNKRLKELACRARIDKELSTNVARHSWVAMAAEADIPAMLISEALGYKKEKSAVDYLSRLEASASDSVSDKVSELIK